eukprot:CAMPEP_0180668614 /NCGR_PEP_ID=MMETSP1037_2-20121125/63022_1 /TAXON_ID=632150 /ORGANISM="Azadinium spinosum, Strain 3D9" /LENGTH=64 /DNA_ID=CAMNT_0022697361 /DNA_START=202 /DNA_END=396 /DNA_ORIENTATION=+
MAWISVGPPELPEPVIPTSRFSATVAFGASNRGMALRKGPSGSTRTGGTFPCLSKASMKTMLYL